jgi:RND family efflux transporter MFP subunit
MNFSSNPILSGVRNARGLSLLALPIMLSLLGGACKSDYPTGGRQAAPGGKSEARQVRTVPVAQTPVGETVTVNGTLAAYDQTTVSVKVPGRLRVISVDLGSVVRRGQNIAQLETTDYRLRVQQSEAALAQARVRLGLSPDGTDDRVSIEQTGTVRQARAVLDEAKLKRERAIKLVEQSVISREEYERVDAEYKVALSRYQDAIEEIRNRQGLLAQRRSELALARQQLADSNVYSPLDGVVEQKQVSVGEYLAAGAPLVTIVRMDPLRLRAEVPERESRGIRMGQSVRVSVEGDPVSYMGHVKRLSPTITQQSRVLVVEADVANSGRLRPGSFVRADIVTDEAKVAVTVPTSAIVTFAGIEKVIQVQNGKAIEKPVTTGRRGPDWVEIIAGVNVGEAVVLEPGNLQTGSAVEVVQ